MRVSTKTFQLQWLNSFTRSQSNLVDIQRQVSTGRRVSTAADDPAGAAQMILLQNGLEKLDSYSANADTARRRLSLSESALTDATDLMDRARELAIQAGGASQTPETRAALADEAGEIFKSLLDIANSQDGEGRYLFGGNRVTTLPFAESASLVTYNGDDGTRVQRIGDNRTVAEGNSGSEVFGSIRNGNGSFEVIPGAANTGTGYFSSATVNDTGNWPNPGLTISFPTPDTYEVSDTSGVIQAGSFAPGDTISVPAASVTIEGEPAAGDRFQLAPSQNQNLFTMVKNFITTMEGDVSTPAARARQQSLLNANLLDFDRGLENLSAVRSSVGSRLNLIEQQAENNADLGLQYTQTLSLVRDVDYASAISELEQQLMSLEAAQRSFAKTRSFSLFNII